MLYLISGGGYGGSMDGDGLSNGRSTIGISKTTPIEVVERRYPVLIEQFSLHEGSGGAGEHRGGFGVNYTVKIRRGEACASFVMDHGRYGPQGAPGGRDGGPNKVRIERAGQPDYIPPHLSKDQDIRIAEGDRVHVSTPRGGGFGDPLKRDPEAVRWDLYRGYHTIGEAEDLFGVVVAEGKVDGAATAKSRAQRAGQACCRQRAAASFGADTIPRISHRVCAGRATPL